MPPDFKAKMHQIRLQRSTRPLAVFKGSASKGREGKGEGKGRGKERGKEGREDRDGYGSMQMHPLGFSKVGACA